MMFKQRLILIVALAVIHVVNGQRSPDVTVQDATVRLRKDAIINCTYTIFDGRTLSGVTWYKSTSAGAQGDRLVSSAVGSNPNGRYSVETSQAGVTTLTISNALLSDDGFYQCAVTDSGILTTSHFGSLTVQYLDDVMIDISSNTTANVTITCSANGSPPPMMNLLKDDVVIDTENNSPLTYTIGNVTESDGGSYKCTATNSVGSKESETIVLHYFKPGVTLDPDEATVGPGSIVTMTAIVTANPDDITYNWTTDDPEIVVTDTSSSTFTFKVPESAEDGTEYIVTVEVTNSIGSTTQSAKITVKKPTPRPTPPEPTTGPPSEGLETWVIVIIIIIIVIFVLLSIGILIYIICCYDEWSRLSTELKSACVVVCLLGFGIIVVLIIIYYERKENGRTSKLNDPPNDPTSGPVVPQEDVEMKQSKENSDLKRYAASGGELYTEVNLKDKKKKPDNDTGSSKPAPVDMNVEGLQYADLDLTRNLPTGKKDVINHPDQETTYSSIQTQRI